ncbi:sodium channel subunit beta-3 [Platysternon megacephalum]|uniref:Sodium channel subunit beta-3 n=1 Tax=Platysternon megacephalum TaxID=55544 RepID=A0A4D9E958_9SAUR|nr:sodium channel subunit beta-3 [Platysternon megacephalum]
MPRAPRLASPLAQPPGELARARSRGLSTLENYVVLTNTVLLMTLQSVWTGNVMLNIVSAECGYTVKEDHPLPRCSEWPWVCYMFACEPTEDHMVFKLSLKIVTFRPSAKKVPAQRILFF